MYVVQRGKKVLLDTLLRRETDVKAEKKDLPRSREVKEI